MSNPTPVPIPAPNKPISIPKKRRVPILPLAQKDKIKAKAVPNEPITTTIILSAEAVQAIKRFKKTQQQNKNKMISSNNNKSKSS